VQQIIDFVQANLTLVLAFSLVAVTFFAFGLLVRRRHVIQILPAPVSPGLERAISAALSSREIVYVQPAPAPVIEPVRAAAAPVPVAAPVLAATPAPVEKQALSKGEELLHEVERIADKIAHEAAAALDAAAKDALLAILGHMEHHGDDAWFKAMHDRIEHAKSNSDLASCAAEMIKHLHGDHH